jgi:hypothetical protein
VSDADPDWSRVTSSATEAQRRGKFHGVTRRYPNGSFDFEEVHYQLSCGCRVIDGAVPSCCIVAFCEPHEANYRRILPPGSGDSAAFLWGAERAAMAARWDGVP